MFRTLVATLSVAVLPCMTSAQPFSEWGIAGGWYIFLNEATGNCAMERVTEEEIALELALLTEELESGDRRVGAVALWLPGAPPETEPDVPFAEILVNGNTYFGESRIVVRDDGYWGGYMITDAEVQLELDMAAADQLTITTYTGDLAYMDLTESDVEAALVALETCQAESS